MDFHPDLTPRYKAMYPALLGFSVVLIAAGLLVGDPDQLLPGLGRILLTENALITDYVLVAGLGAALVNSGVVSLISIAVLLVTIALGSWQRAMLYAYYGIS